VIRFTALVRLSWNRRCVLRLIRTSVAVTIGSFVLAGCGASSMNGAPSRQTTTTTTSGFRLPSVRVPPSRTGPFHLVLSSERDGDLDVYRAMPGALVDLTRNNVGDAAAVLAPDGERVAVSRAGRIFVVDRGGSSEFVGAGAPVAFSNDGRLATVTAGFVLQIAARDARGEWKLRTVQHAEAPHRLAWSADGRRIVYDDGSDFGTIHVVDATHAKRLPRTFEQYDVDAGAAWSPTGNFAYGENATNPHQIIVRDSDEKLVGRVTGDPWTIGWSPRGVLTFGGLSGLYVGTAPTARRITRAPIQSFAWSPRGDRLAIVEEAGDARSVRTIDVHGRRAQPLPLGAPSSTAAPVWSPDGRAIAFVVRRSAYMSVRGRPRLLARGRQMRILGWAHGRIHGSAHRYIPPPGVLTRVSADVVELRGHTYGIAAEDHRLVALAVVPGNACYASWDHATGELGMHSFCSGDVYDLALHGKRVTWKQFSCGNSCYIDTHAARTDTPAGENSPAVTDVATDRETRPPSRPPPRSVSGFTMHISIRQITLSREGQTATITRRSPITDAALTSEGVFYIYSTPSGHDRIEFTPYARLFR
jgi:hypothetical protein